jgi:tetratricopeptide (TPR) repeat protein
MPWQTRLSKYTARRGSGNLFGNQLQFQRHPLRRGMLWVLATLWIAAQIPLFAQEAELRAQIKAAEDAGRRALSIRRRSLSPDHPDIARSLNNLGEIHRRMGEWSIAEWLYLRAMTALEKSPVPDPTVLQATLANLGTLSAGQHNYGRAESYYQRALALIGQADDPQYIRQATLLANLAQLRAMEKEYTEADQLWQRALEAARSGPHPDQAFISSSPWF